MAKTNELNNKYEVKDYVLGNYDYDTIFIEVGENKESYQIPVRKRNDNKNLVGKFIVIDKFDTPIEKIVE